MREDEILKEFDTSKDTVRKLLLTLNRALNEHGEILKEAAKRNIPPEKLLDWILKKIL
jgi:hypothetical protein